MIPALEEERIARQWFFIGAITGLILALILWAMFHDPIRDGDEVHCKPNQVPHCVIFRRLDNDKD